MNKDQAKKILIQEYMKKLKKRRKLKEKLRKIEERLKEIA